jgi:excinuclease ABC subunit C
VGLIPVEDYRQAISEAILFLQGQSEAIITHWVRQMNQEAHALHYEQAALYRDRIKNLQKISEQQSVSHVEKIDADVVTAALQQGEYVSVVLLRFRSGRLMGSHFFEAKIPLDETLAQALLLFLSQYYLEQGSDQIPAEIVSDIGIDDAPLLLDFLYQKTQRRVSFQSQGSGVKGLRARWLSLAHQNLIEKTKPFEMRCDLLQEALKLGTEAFTVECFDISHTFGTHAVGACVVLNRQGFQKKLFRRYHLAQHRDDISALKEVLMRRYQKHPLPNVIVMDGGRTQVQMAGRVLSEYRSGLGYQTEASGLPCILGIVKGQRRKAQYDRILRWAPLTGDSTGQIQGQIQEWMFEPQDPIRHLIQQVRDEAHRFAITGHRTLRTKAQQHSIIQNIPGMGAKRRKVLLNHLGGWQEIESATLEQLIRVPGIGVKIAEKMIEFLKQNKKNKG